MRSRSQRNRWLLLAVLFPLVFPLQLSFELPQPTDSDTAAAVGQAGMRAYLDEETGRLTHRPADPSDVTGPTPTEAARLSRDSFDLLPQDLGEAGVLVDLEGRFATATVATIGPDGRITLDCQKAPVEREVSDDR